MNQYLARIRDAWLVLLGRKKAVPIDACWYRTSSSWSRPTSINGTNATLHIGFGR